MHGPIVSVYNYVVLCSTNNLGKTFNIEIRKVSKNERGRKTQAKQSLRFNNSNKNNKASRDEILIL